MTPKEKARELVSKYIHLTKQTNGANGTLYNSKQCALIAVDELLNISLPSSEYGGVITDATIEYWQEVKQEIEKL